MSSQKQKWHFLSRLTTTEDEEDDEKVKEEKVKEKKERKNQTEAPDSRETTMSRGPKPEMEVDFDKLRPLTVWDEEGRELLFTDLFADKKTIVVFVRHFLDFITKEYVEDLAIIPPRHLQDAEVNLVVIGPSPYKFIKSFKALTQYRYPLYCDPDRLIYKALGLQEKFVMGDLKYSRHVKSGVVGGVLKSVWRAMESKEHQGDTKQQGGAFILGPGEQVHFYHQDAYSSDHVNINDLLWEAGVQQVCFPRDQRVFTV